MTTAEERAARMLAKKSPATHTEPKTSTGERLKPFRVTVDLEPADYDTLRLAAAKQRKPASEILRELVRTLQ